MTTQAALFVQAERLLESALPRRDEAAALVREALADYRARMAARYTFRPIDPGWYEIGPPDSTVFVRCTLPGVMLAFHAIRSGEHDLSPLLATRDCKPDSVLKELRRSLDTAAEWATVQGFAPLLTAICAIRLTAPKADRPALAVFERSPWAPRFICA